MLRGLLHLDHSSACHIIHRRDRRTSVDCRARLSIHELQRTAENWGDSNEAQGQSGSWRSLLAVTLRFRTLQVVKASPIQSTWKIGRASRPTRHDSIGYHG